MAILVLTAPTCVRRVLISHVTYLKAIAKSVVTTVIEVGSARRKVTHTNKLHVHVDVFGVVGYIIVHQCENKLRL